MTPGTNPWHACAVRAHLRSHDLQLEVTDVCVLAISFIYTTTNAVVSQNRVVDRASHIDAVEPNLILLST